MNGEPRKEHHKGKWEQVVQKATRSLQEMLRAASQRRRNVIIDQVREMSFGALTFARALVALGNAFCALSLSCASCQSG